MKNIPGHPDIIWWRAVSVMLGGAIGVGVLGLPFAFAKSGWVVGIVFLLVLAPVLLAIDLMYAEIVSQTHGKHRLIGYIKKYLGPFTSHLTSVLFVPYVWGAMLAFMLVGGDFLYILVSPFFGGSILWYQVAIAILAGILTLRGVKKMAKIELVVMGVLLFLFLSIILISLPSIQWHNVSEIHWSNWFLPYGVILFALSGYGIIPEVKEVLGNRWQRDFSHTVITGKVTIVSLYAFFTLAVVGVTGALTTALPFSGLALIFGKLFAIIGALLGSFVAVSVSSAASIELQDIFRFDYRLPQKAAWFLSSIFPIALLFLGINKFVDLIGFLGGIFGGIMGIIIVVTYEKMRRHLKIKKHFCFNAPTVVSGLIILVFFAGIVQTILGL